MKQMPAILVCWPLPKEIMLNFRVTLTNPRVCQAKVILWLFRVGSSRLEMGRTENKDSEAVKKGLTSFTLSPDNM